MTDKLKGSAIAANTIPSNRIQSSGGVVFPTINVATANITTVVTGNNLTLSTGTGSNGNIIFSANGTERMRVDTSGRLLIGSTTARAILFNSTFTSPLQVEGTSFDTSNILVVRNENNSSAAGLVLGKTRGTTVGNTAVVANGDGIGFISFQASDGTEFVEAARIQSLVDSDPGANDMPGRIIFSTTADGAAGVTERMRITANGNVGIGTTTPTGLLDVASRGITKGSLPTGTILQVVSNTITAAATVAAPNGTEVSVTGYSATITPTSNTSKILILFQVSYCSLGTTYGGYFKRGSTVISQGDAAGSRQRVGFPMALATDMNQSNAFFYQFLDSPATTSSTTYQFFVNNDNTQQLFLNRSSNDSDAAVGKRSTSTITLIEVAA